MKLQPQGDGIVLRHPHGFFVAQRRVWLAAGKLFETLLKWPFRSVQGNCRPGG